MHIARFALLTAFVFAAPALAQGMSNSSSMSHMDGMGAMHHNASMHSMPATVTSVDAKTGMVEVNSEGMALKVHFPPASLAGLKAGDKIKLQLGFTKQ